jgi:hypothetical protein
MTEFVFTAVFKTKYKIIVDAKNFGDADQRASNAITAFRRLEMERIQSINDVQIRVTNVDCENADYEDIE